MKLFILTHCAAGENYTPQVCKTLEDAQNALTERFNECINATIGDDDTLTKEEAIDCYIDNYEVYNDGAQITYRDDTYDVFQIFEVEVDA